MRLSNLGVAKEDSLWNIECEAPNSVPVLKVTVYLADKTLTANFELESVWDMLVGFYSSITFKEVKNKYNFSHSVAKRVSEAKLVFKNRIGEQ